MIRDAIIGGLALICFAIAASYAITRMPAAVLDYDASAITSALEH